MNFHSKKSIIIAQIVRGNLQLTHTNRSLISWTSLLSPNLYLIIIIPQIILWTARLGTKEQKRTIPLKTFTGMILFEDYLHCSWINVWKWLTVLSILLVSNCPECTNILKPRNMQILQFLCSKTSPFPPSSGLTPLVRPLGASSTPSNSSPFIDCSLQGRSYNYTFITLYK